MKRAVTTLTLWLCWLYWLCWLSADFVDAQQRATQGQATRKAVLIGQPDPVLLERIRGQTGDLIWDLVVEETTGQPNMEQARTAAERHGVEAVIWFEAPASGGLVVKVAEVEQNRLFTRRIEPPGKEEVHAYSTTAEAAALVVRSSLMSLASGAPLSESFEERPARKQTAQPELVEPGSRGGTTEEALNTATGRQKTASGPAEGKRIRTGDVDTEEERSAEDGPEEAKGDDTEEKPAEYGIERGEDDEGGTTTLEPDGADEPDRTPDLRMRTSLGWQLAVDGQSPLGQHALDLRLVLELGSFEIGLQGSLGILSARMQDDANELAVRVNRHAALGGVGVALLATEDMRLTAGLAAGVVAFYRRTYVYIYELRAKPSAYLYALVLRGGFLAQWFPAWTDRVLGLELEIGADAIPAAPVFSLREADGVSDRFELWPVHVVAVLGVVMRYGI